MAVQYSDLVNKNGTIYNTAGATANTDAQGGYSDPNKLSADLGTQASALQWGQIKNNNNYTPTQSSSLPLNTLSPANPPTSNSNVSSILGMNSSSTMSGNSATTSSSLLPVPTSGLSGTATNTPNSNLGFQVGGKVGDQIIKGTLPPLKMAPAGANPNYPSGQATTSPASTSGSVKTASVNFPPETRPGPTLPNGTQTYKLGNGDVYSSDGNLITRAGDNVHVVSSSGINSSSPSSSTPSTSLGNAPGNADISASLNKAYENEQNVFANLQQYSTVPPSEMALQQKVASDQAQVTALGFQEQGLYNPGNQTIAMPFLTGQAQNQMLSAQLQQTIDQANLAYAQGNRQFAFNSANTIYNASRNNLADMVSIYQASAPKNIATNYNPLTGEVNTTMINPLSGETYMVNNGNIGASQPIQNVTSTVNPLNGQLTISGTDATGKPVTYSLDSNGKITGNSMQGGTPGSSIQGGQPGSLVSPHINPQAVVGGYDLTSYAGASSQTGQYGPTVNSLYNKIPQISNAQDAQNYISSVSKNSPITGDMVIAAAAQYQVDPRVMMAVMQEESSMGTAGMATRTFNPGNVGNNSDTGKATNWGSWQSGVNAVAHNLQERQINPVQQASQGSRVQGAGSPQEIIQQVINSLPTPLQGAVKTLPDGTPYLDGNQITSAQIPMAQNASQMGIPYINNESSSKLQVITTTQKNLQDFQTLADSALSSHGWGAQYLNYAGLVGSNIGGGTKLNDFNSYRTAAINAIQSLGSGQGSGFRLNQYEINVAIDNLPTPTDTKAQADRKIMDLSSQMDQWISTIVPGWIPPK